MKHILTTTILKTTGALSLTLLAVAAISCKGESPEHKAAVALDTQADSAISAGDFRTAIILLDSLNKTYPREIEIRKTTAEKRARAFEGLAMSQIPVLDARIDSLRKAEADIQPLFITIRPSESLPPYAVFKSAEKPDFASSPCLQGRVNIDPNDAADTPWSIAVNAGRNIGLSSVSVTTRDGHTFTMPVMSADGQVGTISPENADETGQYLFSSGEGDPALNVTASGSRGKATFRLTPAQSKGIGEAWHYANVRTVLRATLIDRERADRMLIIARDQKANSAPVASAKEEE